MRSYTQNVGPYTCTVWGRGVAVAVTRGDRDVVFMQGDDAAQLVDELENVQDEWALADMLAEYDAA